jgi:hypothetical protein
VRVGDIVRIHQEDEAYYWPEAQGSVGIIVGLAKRLHIPAARVMVLGEFAEFDLDELEAIDAKG